MIPPREAIGRVGPEDPSDFVLPFETSEEPVYGDWKSLVPDDPGFEFHHTREKFERDLNH